MAKIREPETQSTAVVKRGVYAVRMDGLTRRHIDTGMPAGPAAEAVARDRYLAALQLGPRHAAAVTVTLE